MTKKNPNLTAEQKLIMFEDGTELPETSELNNELSTINLFNDSYWFTIYTRL